MKRILALVLVAALLPAAAVAATSKKTLQLRSTSLGRVIVDRHGMTLYMLSADGRNSSTCSGACASNWPPAKPGRHVTLAKGLKRSKLRVIHRSDGKRQLAYAGHPLYRYIGDSSRGDVNGEGIVAFGGTWYALGRSGAAVTGAQAQPAPQPQPQPSPYPYPYPGY